MKKRTDKKISTNTRIKKQPPAISKAADQDIVGLLTVLVQKLTSFEAKIDMILGRIPALQAAVPQQPQPMVLSLNKQSRESRPMFKAVCADCGADCEVPFKPREDRPVYCKACFATHKAKGIFRPQETRQVHKGSGQGRGLAAGDFKEESRRAVNPKEEPSGNAVPAAKTEAAAPVKPLQKKKPVAKKKKASRK